MHVVSSSPASSPVRVHVYQWPPIADILRLVHGCICHNCRLCRCQYNGTEAPLKEIISLMDSKLIGRKCIKHFSKNEFHSIFNAHVPLRSVRVPQNKKGVNLNTPLLL